MRADEGEKRTGLRKEGWDVRRNTAGDVGEDKRRGEERRGEVGRRGRIRLG